MDNKHKPRLVLGNIDGPEGNVFVILGRAQEVIKRYNEFVITWNESQPVKKKPMDNDAIQAEAKTSDYEHVLDTLEKYFDVQATGGRYES